MSRLAVLAALVALSLLSVAAPSAVAAPAKRTAKTKKVNPKPLLPAPGAWEAVDQEGRLVSFDVDRRNRIVRFTTPGPIECNPDQPVGFGGARFGVPLEPMVVTRARFGERVVRREYRRTITGRVIDRTTIQGTVTASRATPTPCGFRSTFTARRLTKQATPATLGRWTGTDALGGTVEFDVKVHMGWLPEVVGITIAGPWNACMPPLMPPLAGRYSHFSTDLLTAWELSRANGQVVINQHFRGPLGLGLDAGRVVGAPGPYPDGSTVHRTFEGTLTGSTASGTWRTRGTGPDGDVRCDSGVVAWQASTAG